jgi:heme exporter protein A
MLQAKDLTCIRDERVLFSRLSLHMAPGDILQVTGRNGSGKTSLLKILAGLIRPESGDIQWNQRNIQRFAAEYHRDLLYIGHQAGIKLSLTPLDNLVFYQAAAGAARDERAIWLALEQVGLAGYEEVPAAGLSSGQQRRIAMARLWLSPASLWLLDEPFSALDKDGIVRLQAKFAAHSAAQGMVVFSNHQVLPETARRLRVLSLASPEEQPCSG